VRYSGSRHVQRIGHYHGTYSAERLTALENRIRNAGFDELSDTIGFQNPDLPTITVTVGNKTVLDANGLSGELDSIVGFIEAALQDVEWDGGIGSGIRGAIPIPFTVRDASGNTYAPETDVNGSYILPLRPGTYTILKQTVVVHEREWVTVNWPTAR
jgi:hypothetical protein